MFRDAGFTGRYPLNGYTFRCSCASQLSRLPVYVLDERPTGNRICRETWALWSLCPGLGAARFAKWPENTKKFLMRCRHIDRHAVRIGELELAVLTLSKQFQPNVPFRASRFWR